MSKFKLLFVLACLFISNVVFASESRPWNSPYELSNNKTFYSSIASQISTLDQAKAFSSDAYQILGQIVEPPLQYHHVLRPYKLIPSAAKEMPEVICVDKNGLQIDPLVSPAKVAYTTYRITLRDDLFYAPHPAFSRSNFNWTYHNLNSIPSEIRSPMQFKSLESRRALSYDFVYQIKRLASPKLSSPIFGLMSQHIVGLKELGKYLVDHPEQDVNLYRLSLTGVKAIDEKTIEIKIYGYYPQFIYWLAMPFFSPVPWEVDNFYKQPALIKRNITLSWWPVGTGPYYLAKHNPNQKVALVKNPNFHLETYPIVGPMKMATASDIRNQGRKLPMIDTFSFSIEKESIPRWQKFMQGYYDRSGIGMDQFDQAIEITKEGRINLSDKLKNKKLNLKQMTSLSTMYIGFNLLDKKIGGYSPRAVKLRRAIAIAINPNEFISIFLNGMGNPAHSPIPTQLFGAVNTSKSQNNYNFFRENGEVKPRPLSDAKALLSAAGYPKGIDPQTKKPLRVDFHMTGTSPNSKAIGVWLQKKLLGIGIDCHIYFTEYNRFQKKIRGGMAQMFFSGWNADYPDPENLLFLLYGPNGKVRYDGENIANYSNKNYDKLYVEMKNLPDGPKRAKIIAKMLAIVQKDQPWIWGYHPISLVLRQPWLDEGSISSIANNGFKYMRLNGHERQKIQGVVNRPNGWFLVGLLFAFFFLIMPIVWVYWRRQRQPICFIDYNSSKD